jgi:ribonuclease T
LTNGVRIWRLLALCCAAVNEFSYNPAISQRFRGYLPVVVDVETAGFDAKTDALLEIAAVTVCQDESGRLAPAESFAHHVLPFEGANLDPKALAFNGIDPYNPLRGALEEKDALVSLFAPIRAAVKASGCKRAILVGHNAFFDLGFVNAAVERHNYKRCPFHPFSTFDTVTLAGLAYGQTVLARSAIAAGMDWDAQQAHGAVYDAQKTAELFCGIVNQWQDLGGPQPWLSPGEETPESPET